MHEDCPMDMFDETPMDELDTEHMLEWWENDIHEEYPQEWLSDPIHIDDQYGWWKPSQPT